MTSKITIFQNETSDSSSLEFVPTGLLNSSLAVLTQITIFGEFGGASVTLEYKADDNNWYPTGDAAFTSSCTDLIELCPALSYRLTISGATGTTDISSVLYNAKLA